MAGWSLPDEFLAYNWIASPLQRALRTAELLRGQAVATDDRLREMAWGEWEGKILAELRAELGDLMVAWEAKGLDFRGPGGESPREVQERVRPLLSELAAGGTDTVAVCHKGVIRALYAIAVNWDMKDKPPHRLLDGCAQIFELDGSGLPHVSDLNKEMTRL